jgi:uncharacterized membrane protein
LSDGIFAVAMTLLVLEIHVPEIAGVHTERDLPRALAPLLPRLLVYLMSFLTLGIFWNGQQVSITAIAISPGSTLRSWPRFRLLLSRLDCCKVLFTTGSHWPFTG